MYVVLRKIGRVEPPLLPKNRKRLCFLDAWLGAALRRILGTLFPTKGVFCLAPRVQWDTEEAMGSSALLESISRLIPLNTIGFPPQLGRLSTPIKPERFPLSHCSLPAWGVAPCCPLLVFCRALGCQFLFPDVSLWFSPCLAPVLGISGSKYPHRCLRAAPGSARGPEQHVCTIL